MSMRTAVAPASIAFSTSSLTTDAGRSIVSPAAIPAATPTGSTRIPPVGETRSVAGGDRSSPPIFGGGIEKAVSLWVASVSTRRIQGRLAPVLPAEAKSARLAPAAENVFTSIAGER
jgi:hypothetical protein